MACILCYKPSFAGQRSVLHPESFNNKEQRGFFAKFVSPGYKWPEGLDTLYLCRRSCHAKIRQGIARAADLTKLVNDLRAQFNKFTSTLTEIEIRTAAMEVPGAVTPPSYKTQSNEDGINLQTRKSQLGKRNVPCKLPSTPKVRKVPRVTDAQEGASRRTLLYETQPPGAEGAIPESVIKGKGDDKFYS